MNRRDLLKLSFAAASLLLAGCTRVVSEPIVQIIEVEPDIGMLMPKSDNERVVIVGGGWAGLSMAKHMKRNAPQMDVILLEQRSHFFSLPTSNLWLVGAIDMEYLIHDYLQAARENDYIYINTTVVDVDKMSQQVVTTHGALDYDYLVLCPGIEYDYAQWTLDSRYQRALQTLFPAGFLSSSELLTIRNKIFDFQKGRFVISVPSGNFRAWAAPYERAALMADFFLREGRTVEIVILDENPQIREHRKVFETLFTSTYASIIKYRPNVSIRSVDIENKRLYLSGDEILEFDDAILYPRVKNTRLLEKIGILDASGRVMMDPLSNAVHDYENIFVIGDARSMPFNPLGSTAMSEAKLLSRRILYRSMGEKLLWTSPQSESFCAVGIEPLEVVFLQGEYRYTLLEKRFDFVQTKAFDNIGSTSDDKTLFEWASGAFAELFKA